MIFTLISTHREFKVTFKNESLYIGNLDKEHECFVIHSSQFINLYDTLFSMIKALNLKVDIDGILFQEKFDLHHFYFWSIKKEEDTQEPFIKLLCKDIHHKVIFFLKFNCGHLYKFLRCFQYFLLTTLPLSTRNKLWLKRCTDLDLTAMKNNLFSLYEESLNFCRQIQLDSDVFEQIELFHHYFHIIHAYQNITYIIDSVSI
jgi:hypothetical protein